MKWRFKPGDLARVRADAYAQPGYEHLRGQVVEIVELIQWANDAGYVISIDAVTGFATDLSLEPLDDRWLHVSWHAIEKITGWNPLRTKAPA